MPECPSKDCHDRVDGHHRTLFGLDGKGGMIGCLSKYVTRKTLWIALLAIGIPIFAAGLIIWADNRSFGQIYVKKDALQLVKDRVTINESRFQFIREAIVRIETAQSVMQKDIKELRYGNR